CCAAHGEKNNGTTTLALDKDLDGYRIEVLGVILIIEVVLVDTAERQRALRDRHRHGCRCRAYRDVLTACPAGPSAVLLCVCRFVSKNIYRSSSASNPYKFSSDRWLWSM